ncbi:MAG: hypothetical protein ACRDWA_01120 [Acidimicrobiia bacterium]
MSSKTDIPELPTDQPKARRRPNPALVGILLAALVTAVVLVPWTDGGSIIDSFSATPVDVSNQYMEARNAYDAEKASALMTADASVLDVPRMDRGGLAGGFEALRVYEASFEPFECTSKEGTTLVNCTYAFDTNLSRIVGYPAVEGSIQLLVEDGMITSLVHNFNFDDYAVFEKFAVWLGTEHPDEFFRVYEDRGGVLSPITTPEALAQLRGFIEEYDRSVNG